MAVSERTRFELYEAVRRILGDEPAETLMAMLPPVGWADVATKHDLAAVQGALEARIGGVETRLDAVETRLDAVEARIGGVEAHLGNLSVTVGSVDTKAESMASKVELHAEINRLILWFVPLNMGLAFAAARLG